MRSRVAVAGGGCWCGDDALIYLTVDDAWRPDRIWLHRLGGVGDDILLLHDGHAARTTDGQPVILAMLPRLLATLNERQLKPVTLDAALK